MESAWTRWVAIAAVVLLAGVTLAMCAGLSDDSTHEVRARPTLPDETDETETETEGEPEPEPEQDAGSDEVPPPDGVRVLVGTVTDEDGEPVDRAEVAVVGQKRSSESDPDGTYRLRGVPAAKVEIVVSGRGYTDEHISLDVGEAGVEERLDVVLEDGDVVVGTVVNQDGKPVARAKVTCADNPRDANLTAETDYLGIFELPGRAVGCDAIARHSAHPDSPRVVMELGPKNLIALGLEGVIAGTVVDPAGAIIRAFTLSIESFTPAPGSLPTPERRYRQTFYSPEGKFTISALAPGTYVLQVSVSGHPDVKSSPITLKGGEQRRDLRLAVP